MEIPKGRKHWSVIIWPHSYLLLQNYWLLLASLRNIEREVVAQNSPSIWGDEKWESLHVSHALRNGSANHGLWPKSGLPSVSENKLVLEHRYTCTFIFLLSMAALVLQWQSWEVMTEAILPQHLKYLLSDPLEKTLANPCSKRSFCTLF